MIRLPSIVHPTAIAWSRDSAFNLEDPEFEHKFKVARETGDYGPVIKDGQRPTFFHCRIIPGTILRKLLPVLQESSNSLDHSTIVFRLAIQSIEGIEGLEKVEFEQDEEWGRIAKASIVDALDRVSASIVNEVAAVALDRSVAPLAA